MPLEKDFPGDRARSNGLDAKHGGKPIYDKAVRPIIHGAYHGARYLGYRAEQAFNPEELARAKDQFSKFGSGQTTTEYLQKHREQIQKQQQQQERQQQIQEVIRNQMFPPPLQQPQIFPWSMQQQWPQPQQQLPQKSVFDLHRKN